MDINSGELIKQVRKTLSINQQEMADKLYIDRKHLSRLENNERKLDIWQFISMMEIVGMPTEDFWLLFLESDEYEGYLLYKRLNRLTRNRQLDEAVEVLTKLEQHSVAQRPFVKQYILCAKVVLDKDLLPEAALEKLHNALSMTKIDFDEDKVSSYALTYSEVSIITEIAIKLYALGEIERAIEIKKGLVENKDGIRTTDADKAMFLPPLLFNLSNFLGKAEKHDESLKYSKMALEVSWECENLRAIPHILCNIASSLRLLGEEEQIYRTYLVRAYHSAFALGRNDVAAIIKNCAEKDFGIVDLDKTY